MQVSYTNEQQQVNQ